ncbi:MAG: MATE family efflux transporter [Muribaculaceae bacterium]|nr:MATE family efflux transporter [Muribaculaceae bacterium]
MDRLNREIFRLSVPTIVSNITVPLLGICDTAISGHLGSELFLSAIAVGSVMLNVVFWIFGFLRGGTTGLTANALGASDKTEISKVFYRSFMLAICAGGFLIALQTPIFRFLWFVAGSGDDIKISVENYYNVRILGSPALLGTMAISGWFVGMQTTFYPMLIAIAMNLVNIVASCVLVYVCDEGFNGVATGTLIANWIGLVIALGCVIWFLKGKFLKITLSELFKGNWWRYFSVNGNLFIRSFFIICVTLGVTSAGARIDYLTLAVNVIVMQFFQFFSFFMDGFAFSGEAMVGLYSGERNFIQLKKCVGRLLRFTVVTALIFFMVYLFGTIPITSLLTDNGEVIEKVGSLTLVVALIPVVSCWAFIFDGFYIGITDTYKMMISALLGFIFFFLIIFLNFRDVGILFSMDRNVGIWIAFLSYLLARGAYLWMMWEKTLKKYIILRNVN